MDRLRVVLADDHALFRAGLCALLDYSDDIEVVGEAQNGREAVELAEALQPDVVVMDIAMPVMNGIEATATICERAPEVKVLVLTQHEEQQYIAPLLEAKASGFITKRAVGADLVTALRAVARGQTYIHPAMGRLIVNEAVANSRTGDELTTREREILRLVVRGYTNTRTAADLGLSVKTVEWHRSNLMRKLGTHGVAELVRYAIQHGLVQKDASASDL
jgi:DNA-binding NarL/FixJ family response regulator